MIIIISYFRKGGDVEQRLFNVLFNFEYYAMILYIFFLVLHPNKLPSVICTFLTCSTSITLRREARNCLLMFSIQTESHLFITLSNIHIHTRGEMIWAKWCRVKKKLKQQDPNFNKISSKIIEYLLYFLRMNKGHTGKKWIKSHQQTAPLAKKIWKLFTHVDFRCWDAWNDKDFI